MLVKIFRHIFLALLGNEIAEGVNIFPDSVLFQTLCWLFINVDP